MPSPKSNMFRLMAKIAMRNAALAVALAAAAFAGGDHELQVADVHGKLHTPLKPESQKATVFVFITHDCPISNGYAPEVNRIVAEYVAKKIAFYVMYVDSDLSATEAARHTKDFDYRCPTLLDPTHQLVERTKTTVTPETAMLTPDGKLVYHDRIDDLYVDYGKRRNEANQRDL